MTNMNQYSDEQWYPQLPEGYTGEGEGMQGGMGGWMPGSMPNYGMMPGMSMPDFDMNWGGSPMYGMPQDDFLSQRGPGFPGGGFPGGGFPGGGFPPGQTPGFPGGGFPPGQTPGFPGGGFPPGQTPGFPGGGFPPGQTPGFPGGGVPGGGFPGQGGQQAPTAPPPSFTPQYPGGVQAFAVDPGGIRRCLFRYTFIWTSRRNGFWFFPTFVGRTSVAGYRWRSRQRRWQYYGIDLNRIEQFTCF